jgi:REP element-mobilizing transposase RayT
MKKIIVKAPAKVNLTLEVLNKREDGFHNIQSIMHTISLFDFLTIEIEKSPQKIIKLTGNSKDIPYDEKNLVYKACDEFLKQSNIENIKVEISQRENLRKELLETFEFIKQQDIKDILDTVNFNRIKELSSSQISEIVESLVNERCEKLLSQDTFKNLRALKQMELSALIKEKEQLLSQKKRYDFLNEKYIFFASCCEIVLPPIKFFFPMFL